MLSALRLGDFRHGLVLDYETNTREWAYWLAGSETLLWAWAMWLVFLVAIYAYATFAFGLRFSNLTYRGVVTHKFFSPAVCQRDLLLARAH